MPQRTKTYIAFDGDSDLMSYRTIQSWDCDSECSFELNDAHEINFARDNSLPQSIINQLKERLDRSKHLVLIIGDNTNKNRKGILQYEINYALRNDLPIILVFKGFSSEDSTEGSLWSEQLHPKIPALIRDAEKKYCLVCPFTRESVQNAIKTYSCNYLPNTKTGFMWNWKA